MIDLSIVIPCYNEEESLPHLLNLLNDFKSKATFSFELVFVDDGSKDKTNELLRSLFKDFSNVQIVKNEKNLNLGGAVRRGIHLCNGKFTAVIDADGSYDPLKLIDMLELAKSEGFDVVSASAHHPQAGFAESTPWWRVFLSQSVQTLYNIVLGTNYCSYTSIFRVYKTSMLKNIEIHSNTFMAMAEILSKLVLKGAKVVDFPAKSNYRIHGVSKARIFQTIWAHLKYLFYLILNKDKMKH